MTGNNSILLLGTSAEPLEHLTSAKAKSWIRLLLEVRTYR